jgi:hypothetical protein
MTYVDILADRIKRRELTWCEAVSFLTGYGIKDSKAQRLLIDASR